MQVHQFLSDHVYIFVFYQMQKNPTAVQHTSRKQCDFAMLQNFGIGYWKTCFNQPLVYMILRILSPNPDPNRYSTHILNNYTISSTYARYLMCLKATQCVLVIKEQYCGTTNLKKTVQCTAFTQCWHTEQNRLWFWGLLKFLKMSELKFLCQGAFLMICAKNVRPPSCHSHCNSLGRDSDLL